MNRIRTWVVAFAATASIFAAPTGADAQLNTQHVKGGAGLNTTQGAEFLLVASSLIKPIKLAGSELERNGAP